MGHYDFDGAYKVTKMTEKSVYGKRMPLRCVWTADCSMQNAYYRPDGTEPEVGAEEIYLGRIKQSQQFPGEYIWRAKDQAYFSPDNGTSTLCTYCD